MEFKPVNHKHKVQVTQGIYLKCRSFTGKHVSICCSVAGFTAWLHDIPFENFCQEFRSSRPTSTSKFTRCDARSVPSGLLTAV